MTMLAILLSGVDFSDFLGGRDLLERFEDGDVTTSINLWTSGEKPGTDAEGEDRTKIKIKNKQFAFFVELLRYSTTIMRYFGPRLWCSVKSILLLTRRIIP